MNPALLKINPIRLEANLNGLSCIGATETGGVHRPALSEVDLVAHDWLWERIDSAGLEYDCDSAGNQSAILRSKNKNAHALFLGSHLDTVPTGGRFDGALGVLAALEVLQTLKESNLSIPITLEAVNFTDEEGTHIGLLGSRAMTGKLNDTDLQHPNLGKEEFEAGLSRFGLTRKGILNAVRHPGCFSGYLELHIEQGAILSESQVDIGIVTAIVGIHRIRLRFTGRADHAGTTPIPRRRDAGRAASIFAAGAWDLVLRDFSNCVINIGNMRFTPGIYNVVPEIVTLDLELRTSSREQLAGLQERLLLFAQEKSQAAFVELAFTVEEEIPPAVMDPTMQQMLAVCAQAADLSHRSMASGAGHDAQCFTDLCPTGMIFIPSAGGISHSPDEFSQWQDCVNGANLLLQAVLRLVHVEN